MRLASTVEEARDALAHARMAGGTIGFVPTMGFLHQGHISLIGASREAGADYIAVSIFVNPKQFGPNEDFSRYPRDLERDRQMLEAAGVDLLFFPPVDAMYPAGSATNITAGGVALPLEGERRPGHFDGVCTVVAKLFHIVQPDIAAFGRKDAQQCAVIEQMVRDLDMPIALLFGETVREHDGLALSSRNSYLSAEERAKAPVLHRALRAGQEAISHGIHEVAAIEKLMHRVVEEEGGVTIDYLVVIDPRTFLAPEDFQREVLLAGALKIGKTRLIDNVEANDER